MKKLLLISLILLSIYPLFGQDFRKVSWGATSSQVIKIEGNDFEQGTGEDIEMPLVDIALVYKRKFGVMDGFLFYLFVKDKLVGGMWNITEDPKQFVLNALKQKLGKPTFTDKDLETLT
jgi:hypothetical protein